MQRLLRLCNQRPPRLQNGRDGLHGGRDGAPAARLHDRKLSTYEFEVKPYMV